MKTIFYQKEESMRKKISADYSFDDYFAEQMKDKEFAKAWEEFQPELQVMRIMAEARSYRDLTQKELSKRSGIDQSEISRIESGTRNPSIRLLNRLAKAMDMDMVIRFVPNDQK